MNGRAAVHLRLLIASRWKGGAVAAAAGALCVTAFAPLGWWFVAYASLAVLFALFNACERPREAAWIGFAFGMGLFVAGVSWIYVSLHYVGGMPAWMAALAVVLFSAYCAIYPALAGALCVKVAPAGPLRLLIAAPAAWMLCEWLRSWVFTGFPWLVIGTVEVPNGLLLPYAPIVGVYGVSLLLAFVAAVLAQLALAWRERVSRFAAIVAVLLIAAGLSQPLDQWSKVEGAPLTVALVQGNVEQRLKWLEGEREKSMARYLAMLQSSSAKLIVLPETALPIYFERAPQWFVDGVRAHAAKTGGDVIVGTVTARERDNALDVFNSAVSIGSAPQQVYSKAHLVPFGEFIPPLFSWAYRWLNIPMTGFSRVETVQPPMQVAGTRLALNICYEDTFASEIARGAGNAQWLLNLTNVAWFGRSIAADQHAQMSAMRAVENGRWMLRSTNTGVTAAINHRGEFVQALPQFTQAVLTVEVEQRSGTTPFAAVGHAWLIGVCVFGLFAVMWRRVAQTRQRD